MSVLDQHSIPSSDKEDNVVVRFKSPEWKVIIDQVQTNCHEK